MARITHDVEHRDGQYISIENYTRSVAIKAHCTRCLGYTGSAKRDCTSPQCPLFPHRGKLNLLTSTSRKEAA